MPRENTGFKMLIHPKDELPDMQNLGMELDLGKHTAVRVETSEVQYIKEFIAVILDPYQPGQSPSLCITCFCGPAFTHNPYGVIIRNDRA